MGLSESREPLTSALPDSAKYVIPTIRGMRLVNLTGAPVEFCQQGGSFDQTFVLPVGGETPTLISDDIAMRNLVVVPDNILATAADAEADQTAGFCITTRRIVPRCINGLPSPSPNTMFLLKPKLFFSAILIGRTDVATMCGPILLPDGRTAWKDLEEFVPRVSDIA